MEGLLKLNHSIQFIEDNLGRTLRMGEIARVACMSTFHFQRMFQLLRV